MLRAAFYSHDTYGLGHLRRCLKVAGALAARFESLEGLILTGSPWADSFSLPAGFRYARLPPVIKVGPEDYRPRTPSAHLAETLAVRQRIVSSELSRFAPDLVVVDNVPCGLHGEILPALRALKAAGNGTAVVLALRDVIDEESVVRRQWEATGAYDALRRWYDELWVFGPPGAPVSTVLPSDVTDKVVYCGCLGVNGVPGTSDLAATSGPNAPPRVLVTGGGGADAGSLVGTYLEALRIVRPPVLHRIVLGPDYPSPERIEGRALAGLGVEIVGFDRNLPDAMRLADVVVAMAGYNTVCEALALGRRLVLVPRTWPRREQLLRARALADAGRAVVVLPEDLTPARLWRAVESTLALPLPPPTRHDGARRAATRAALLLERAARVH